MKELIAPFKIKNMTLGRKLEYTQGNNSGCRGIANWCPNQYGIHFTTESKMAVTIQVPASELSLPLCLMPLVLFDHVRHFIAIHVTEVFRCP